MRVTPKYYSVTDAAVVLGVSERTIHRYMEAGHLDAGTLPGGAVRLPRVQVLGLVRPREKRTA